MLKSQTFGSLAAKLPWWTWVVPLPICFLGTLLSLQAKITTGTSLFYFPLAFALTMTYWWGPRVLLPFYINAAGCAGLWGLSNIALWPVYGLPEVVFVFLSWLFFRRIFDGNASLPNTTQLVYFLLIGILLPLLIYKLMLETIFVLAGDSTPDHYWNLLITTGFGDFVSTFCVSLPLLYFLSGVMARKGLTVDKGRISSTQEKLTTLQWSELALISLLAWCVNIFLGFADYWFLNGILSLYVAVRFGFGATILMNSFILIITYVIPAAIRSDFPPQLIEPAMLKTQLGTTLLYVFSSITARLVSDMRLSEMRLSDRNKELNQMNTEMDRFVYSVSHDLSAPLKSILGLVNISRMTKSEHDQLFSLIEKSAHKLEMFISEVLDYSKNKRSEILSEPVNVRSLVREVLTDLQFMDGYNEITFDDRDISPEIIISDRSRLKIILQNLLSNAIKFRRRNRPGLVKVSVATRGDKVNLSIEDNGEGIKPEYQSKIFNMFFRAADHAQGSGLGLYIAMEAAKKINATISMKSTYGAGSRFTIEIDADPTPASPAEKFSEVEMERR